MDSVIAALPAITDSDLMLCPEFGIAYQADRSHVVDYDAAYFDKCAGYAGQEIAQRITQARIDLVARHFGGGRLVDIGIGSGEFIKSRPNTIGYDVNPVAIEWLKRNDLWADRLEYFGAYSLWDVIEHVPDPSLYLKCVHLHAYVFASLPVFDNLFNIRASKHYRPGEHLTYFTVSGFTNWMYLHGFMLLEVNDQETQAGRESIASFAFKRNRWVT
jgi:hypothetical protein